MSLESVVNLAAEKIVELVVKEVKFLYGVKDQFESLKNELEMMNAFISDMDEVGADDRTHALVKQIRRIAYDAEDVIETYILQAKPQSDSSQANISKKAEKFFKNCVCFCGSVQQTHQVGFEIQSIKERISEAKGIWTSYGGGNGDRKNARVRLKNTRKSYPHNIEDHVVGLDEDINMLSGVLTDVNPEIRVASFVGMGGSGKTTLARKLYNHESIKKHFSCMAWLPVSQSWTPQQILLNIWENAVGKPDVSCTNQVPVAELHGHLRKKRYLIVLDDVWEDKVLEAILPAFPLPNNGSKIIVTTRDQQVVNYPDLQPFTYSHQPRRLNEKESWDLFSKIALINREKSNSPQEIARMEELGKEMLLKCDGLPLGIIALAGILFKEDTLEGWEEVCEAVSSRIMKEGKGTLLYGPVNEMLSLSYDVLPPAHKPCFLYLGMFKEDCEIHVGMLMRMWIAEGFCTPNMILGKEKPEDVARQHLDELVNRCLVLVESRNYEGKVKTIRIHDLVRDLCLRKAKEEDFLEHQVMTVASRNLNITMPESRRTSIYSYEGDYLPSSTMSPHLRSLFYEGSRENLMRQVGNWPWETIHQNFKLLRVLSIEWVSTRTNTIPTEIGSLIHLRLLALVATNIHELPSSIGNLRNLQTLHYKRTSGAQRVKIPDVLWKIEGLRYLHLPFGRLAKGNFKLHTLQHLLHLKGIRGGNWMLQELPRLSPSLQKLEIIDMESNEELEAAFRCPSIREDRLRSMVLFFNGNDLILKSLEPIIHCQHLRKLSLTGRIEDGGIHFPASIKSLWLADTNLTAEATLAAIGNLPNLIALYLCLDSYTGTKWTCTAEQFQRLKQLQVKSLRNLEGWSIETGAMPQLNKLSMSFLPKIRRLPEGLKFITTLQVLRLWEMTEELVERTKGGENGGEDAHIIQHVPHVIWEKEPAASGKLK